VVVVSAIEVVVASTVVVDAGADVVELDAVSGCVVVPPSALPPQEAASRAMATKLAARLMNTPVVRCLHDRQRPAPG
jgi:hypothetical protein